MARENEFAAFVRELLEPFDDGAEALRIRTDAEAKQKEREVEKKRAAYNARKNAQRNRRSAW